MSDSSLPILISSGRRLIIEDVTDTAAFSARRLSFNAKEIQFLCEELARWLAEMYEDDVDPDLSHSLMSGVVLLSIVEKYLPQIKLNKWHKTAGPISFQARDNINIFANVCVQLGMRRSDVCNFSNFEKGDLKQITATLCAFAKLGIPNGLHKVSEDLKIFVDQAYSPPVNVLEIVDESKPSEEELARLEREKQEALERQQKIDTLTKDIEKDRDDFLDAYNRAVNILCQEFAEELSDVEISESDLNSDSDSDSEESIKLSASTSTKSIQLSTSASTKSIQLSASVSAKSIRESVSSSMKSKEEHITAAKKEAESASDILCAMKQKRESLEEEGSDVTAILTSEQDLESKLEQLNDMIRKEEEEIERLKKEEEERLKREEEERLRKEEEERLRREEEERLRKEEEERLKREEEERLRKEEEERVKREEEERLKREEEERIRIVEEERRKREAEEAERKRLEEEEKKRLEEEEKKRLEEEERLRQEEEERKKKEAEEAERKRQEEERLKELERMHEEEERKRREEEEAEAKRKCRCRNKRPKEEDLESEPEPEEVEVTQE